MDRRRLLTHLALVVVGGAWGVRSAVLGAAAPPDDCRVVASTGHSVAGRKCDGVKIYARVDHRPSPAVVRVMPTQHQRPIDRLRSRGEGRLQANGDKAARRELREKLRRKN